MAAAIRPKSYASSTTGVKKSVVEHQALAAGDPDHRGVVAVVQADDQLGGRGRGPGRGQPGDDGLELAGRDLAGAAAAVGVLGEPDRGGRGGHATNLGSLSRRGRRAAPPGEDAAPRPRRRSARPAGCVGWSPTGRSPAGGAPNVAGSRRGADSSVSSRAGHPVEAEPPHRLAFAAPRHQVLVVAPSGRATAAPPPDASPRPCRRGSSRTTTRRCARPCSSTDRTTAARSASTPDEQGARHQRVPAPRVGLERCQDPLERPAALGRVRAVGLRGEGDGDRRCLLGRERRAAASRGSGTRCGSCGRWWMGPLTFSQPRRHVRSPAEASGCLVAPAASKADVAEQLGQAGSIPVRLRHCRSRAYAA